MKKWLFGAILLVLLVVALVFLLAGGKKNGNEIKFVAVTRGDIVERALAVGTIEPEKEIKVKSTIPGIVAEVYFKVGDRVEKGQPLIKISPNPTPLEYAEARRNMEVAEVTLNQSRSELDRKTEPVQGQTDCRRRHGKHPEPI